MNEDILYTPEEIANKLKITKNTVYEMIKRGDLDAHHIGKHLRISSTQFDLYLLKSKGSLNSYDAVLSSENGKTIARVGETEIRVSSDITGNARISIRPEDIILSKGQFISSARNVFPGIVKGIVEDNNGIKVVCDIGITIEALITRESLEEMKIEKGSDIFVIFKAMTVKVYK
ncbi:MAG: helix-turn-helix domain-containing protein [Clostridiales bacterium]|nr:helix-turn-helix domain-containing protein [Clostridiales bacterium]